MLPWLGDPWLIPLIHLEARYREAEDARRWKAGVGETEEEENDRILERNVRRRKKAAMRGQTLQ